MSSVSCYFFMYSFMLSLHLFFGRPLLLLPETSSLNDFTHNFYVVLFSPQAVAKSFYSFVFQERFNRFYEGLLPDVFISVVVQPGLPFFPDCNNGPNYFRHGKPRKDYPANTVILHQPARAPLVPCSSPFGLKLETYLRMSQIPYEVTSNTLLI